MNRAARQSTISDYASNDEHLDQRATAGANVVVAAEALSNEVAAGQPRGTARREADRLTQLLRTNNDNSITVVRFGRSAAWKMFGRVKQNAAFLTTLEEQRVFSYAVCDNCGVVLAICITDGTAPLTRHRCPDVFNESIARYLGHAVLDQAAKDKITATCAMMCAKDLSTFSHGVRRTVSVWRRKRCSTLPIGRASASVSTICCRIQRRSLVTCAPWQRQAVTSSRWRSPVTLPMERTAVLRPTSGRNPFPAGR